MDGKWRSIYSFSTDFYVHDPKGNSVKVVWNRSLLESIIKDTMKLPLSDRIEEKEDEWFFYLADVTLHKAKTPKYIHGWFEYVRLGFHTDVISRKALNPRPNPKAKDESEIHKTYFYCRLSDGLFLLDSHGGNVVTPRRIESYFEQKAKSVFYKHNISQITFSHLTKEGFLEELKKFDAVRLARIRLMVQSEAKYDTTDGVGSLQELARPTSANYIDLTMGKKNARKKGLDIDGLARVLKMFTRDRTQVLSGIIQGSRSDGESETLKLSGIEERHKHRFDVDSKGEVLSTAIIPFMIGIGDSHR